MSQYNKNEVIAPSQTVPGTPIQQMWHILNFHEKRFLQISKELQSHAKDNESIVKQTVEHGILLQKITDLEDKVAMLEKKTSLGDKISFSVNEK